MSLILVDTLMVAGTDVQSVPGFAITDLTGLLFTGPYRGDNEPLDGMDGEVAPAGTKPVDAFDFPLPFSLGPENGSGVVASTAAGMRVQFLANRASLLALFPTNLRTFTRRLTKATTPFYVDDTCNGELKSITWTTRIGDDGDPDPFSVDGVLNLRNRDGGWS